MNDSRASFAAEASFNKRERMLGWLAGQSAPNNTPVAFFLHFGSAYKSGSAAAKRHLEIFHHTGMDFRKIKFEQKYSRQKLKSHAHRMLNGEVEAASFIEIRSVGFATLRRGRKSVNALFNTRAYKQKHRTSGKRSVTVRKY